MILLNLSQHLYQSAKPLAQTLHRTAHSEVLTQYIGKNTSFIIIIDKYKKPLSRSSQQLDLCSCYQISAIGIDTVPSVHSGPEQQFFFSYSISNPPLISLTLTKSGLFLQNVNTPVPANPLCR